MLYEQSARVLDKATVSYREAVSRSQIASCRRGKEEGTEWHIGMHFEEESLERRRSNLLSRSQGLPVSGLGH